MTRLAEILKSWNGKQVDYIKNIYQVYHQHPDFISNLLALLNQDQALQKAITWLIKYHVEQKNDLSKTETTQLVRSCNNLKHWEAQLHFLQILPYLKLEANQVEVVEPLIGQLLGSSKKFVKAWAYNGLYELTQYKPELKNDAIILFNAALETESASVKARIRNLLKKM